MNTKSLRLQMVAALILVSPIAALADEKADAPKDDLAKIQGQWTGKFGPGDGTPLTVVFKGNTVTVKATTPEGAPIMVKGEIRLDESAKPNKAIDWLKFTSDAGDGLPDRQGIYIFEDDNTLKTSTAIGEGVRPASFDSGEFTIVFKRDKTDDAPAAKCAEDAPAAKGDLDKLQGTWTAKVGPDKDIVIAITIKGKAVTLKISTPNSGDFSVDGEVKIDETAKPHKTIDWVNFKKDDGEAAPDNHGLYEFVDANTLRLCSGGPGNDRPTEFKAGDGGPPNLVVMARQDEKK